MLIALIALLVLSLGAAALVRSVNTNAMIAGNFAFKQSASDAASIATEQAIRWLELQTKLDEDNAAFGYYASSLEKLDPTGTHTSHASPLALVAWDGPGSCDSLKNGSFENCTVQPFPKGRATEAVTIQANRVQWVIARLCPRPGPAMGNNCLSPDTANAAKPVSHVGPGTQEQSEPEANGPFYRIVVRSEGPRHTTVFTETIVHVRSSSIDNTQDDTASTRGTPSSPHSTSRRISWRILS